MNERIKELIKQCTSWSEGSTWTSHEEFDKEKFAELIVKECGAYLMSPEFIGRSDLDWSMVLNERFGVEG